MEDIRNFFAKQYRNCKLAQLILIVILKFKQYIFELNLLSLFYLTTFFTIASLSNIFLLYIFTERSIHRYVPPYAIYDKSYNFSNINMILIDFFYDKLKSAHKRQIIN